MRLSGARVLLTGATGGLGEAIARELAARGAKLVLTGRRAEVLEPLAVELSAETIVADLAKRSDLNRLVSQAGEVDVLVANAGMPASGRVGEFNVTQLDRTIDVNLVAPILLARALSEGMVRRRCGHIVMVGSVASVIASPGASVYCATKFGLRGFAHGLRQDLAGSGVGVSVVLPWFIRGAGMFARAGVRLPSGLRTSTPADVAAGVVRAIERDRMEVVVAPPEVRPAVLLGGAAPGILAMIQSRAGAAKLTARLARGRRGKQ